MATYNFVLDETIGGTLTPLILNHLNQPVNISSVTEILFIFKKPDGTIIERVGTVLTTGLDGKALYTFVDGDIDQSGVWWYWIKITAPTFTLSTHEKASFTVEE